MKFIYWMGNSWLLQKKYNDWQHVVLSFVKGREDKDEIQIYNNAENIATDKTKAPGTNSKGNGRIVIGRHFSGLDGKYASVEVDELLFCNQALTEKEITILSKYTAKGHNYSCDSCKSGKLENMDICEKDKLFLLIPLL